MAERLLITGIGADRSGIVNALSEEIAGIGGSIEESRMAVLGGEFAIILLVAGDEKVLASLQENRQTLEEKTGLSIHARLTQRKDASGDIKRYQVDAHSIDHPGIVHSITEFFSSKNINIESLSTDTYAAAHTGTPMFALDMVIEIPTDTQISKFRLAFLEFCDDLQIDASLQGI